LRKGEWMDEQEQSIPNVCEAKSAADEYLRGLGEVETRYEMQVQDLENEVSLLHGQINVLESKNYGLQVAVDHLEDQLKKAKKDCYDPDSPEAMAGEVSAPPTNNQGTASGSGPF
jgi:archaellum component FlaC